MCYLVKENILDNFKNSEISILIRLVRFFFNTGDRTWLI